MANGDSVANEKTKAMLDIILIAKFRIMPTTSDIPPLLNFNVSRSMMPMIRRGPLKVVAYVRNTVPN